MKLDRNINPDGKGKYALIRMRCVQPDAGTSPEIMGMIEHLQSCGYLDYGDTPDSEFFVIRLKDRYAYRALLAYSDIARNYDSEWADEVLALASRALLHQNKKNPD